MAYSPGARISYFSSPDISYGGTVTGVFDERDNALTIFNTMDTVAAFRAAVHGDIEINATGLDGRILLRWTQPTTIGYGSDMAHLRYSITAYPTSTNDGVFAYQGTNQMFVHTNLTADVTHFYSIWFSDDGETFVEP
jgi:hypothetical protein